MLSEDELMQLGDFYMDHVSDYVNRLIDAFPAVPGILFCHHVSGGNMCHPLPRR